MKHRHLNERSKYSCAAIDDVIGRGSRADWAALRDAADAQPSILQKILRVCAAKVADPYEQRYYLWKYHAELDYETLTWLNGEIDIAPEYVYAHSARSF